MAWQSYDTLGDIEYEYVEDADAIAKYGIIKKDIKAIGCYHSQGQANRIGLWTLKSEQALTETCNFSVAIESGIVLRLERLSILPIQLNRVYVDQAESSQRQQLKS